jgi:tetratricopeptide (TPR) repeat protein
VSDLAEKLRKAAARAGPNISLANLPSPDFAFVGREKELADAKEKFHSRTNGRHLLVFGQPGVGTTRFALELAEWARVTRRYEFAIWINCQQFHMHGGRRFSSPQHTASLSDIVTEIAHFTTAQAALKATGREAIVALNARCAGKPILLIVDSLQGEASQEIESFLHAQPSNFDIIATARRNLGWQNLIELQPWEKSEADATAFLATVNTSLGWGLNVAKQRVALNAGLGVPSGIIWSARLLFEGYSDAVVENLGHEGWATLLQHFFAQQYETEIRSQSAKRAAALLSLSGELEEQILNEVVGLQSADCKKASRLLVDSGFATVEEAHIRPVRFASHFLKERMSGRKKLNATVVRDWICNLNTRLSQSRTIPKWGARFLEIEPLFKEAMAAIDASSIHGGNAAAELVELFESLAYFLYSRAYWDGFEQYQQLFVESCLAVNRIDPIVEVCLIWGARIKRQRHSIELSDGFFDRTVEMIAAGIKVSPTTELRIQVARLSLKDPNKVGLSLAQDLELLSRKLEAVGDLEWACRATLHTGNAWAETRNFENAEAAYKEMLRISDGTNSSSDLLWKNEMLVLSASSRGVLANRRGEYELAANLLDGSVDELVQASDRATAAGELALANSRIGRRRAGRARLSECLALREQIGSTKTVLESHPDWELDEGAKDLLSKKGLERFNPWWK